MKIIGSFFSLVSRKANIDIQLVHKAPILIDELYAIEVTIVNKEVNTMKSLK